MVERIGRPCGVLVAKLIEDVGGGVNILAAAIKSPLLDLFNGLVLPGHLTSLSAWPSPRLLSVVMQ